MLRLIVDLHGEHVVGIAAVIGYLHTGFEKTMEQKTWWKGVTYPARVDYVSFQYNELVYVLAVEKLLQLQVPRKATWMRMALGELVRIHSHLVYLGTSALEIGAISMFWYCFRERDLVLDLFEMVAGTRMHTRYFQVGGLAEDIPAGFYEEARTFCERMPKAVDEYEAILNSNKIWLERTVGVGALSAEDAIALGQTGPNLRASGVDWDLRKREPYLAYDQVEFDVPVYDGGDVFDRYKVRVDEMRESVRIIEQCIDRLEQMQGEPWIADDRKVVLPPREELHTSMESLIHHFKIVTEGFRVPEGEVYVGVESPRGESGCTLVSDGDREAVARQVPRPVVRRPARDRRLLPGRRRRRPDRRRRLAGRGDGGRRPMKTLYDEIQEIRARYPVSRSATLPALAAGAGAPRLALAGGVPRGGRGARGDARLLHGGRVLLRHVPPGAGRAAPGRGLHQRLLRARRRPAGARGVPGRARDPRRRDERGRRGDAADDRVRRRLWLGHGRRVDHRYRERVTAADVPAIVEEIRSGG